jgi:uncharacterized membrane protein YcjF (UPF0283 family)
VPRDIVVCDWHYDQAPETPILFARKGLDVVACPWRKPAVALRQLAQMQELRNSSEQVFGQHGLGIMQTTWCGFAAFAEACKAQEPGATADKNAVNEAASCFLSLVKTLSEEYK